jgi:prepilin-type N-terminal cleavage/methylation domain-containing protein
MAQRMAERSRRGFTMLELIIVLAVVGILALVSIGKSSAILTRWRVTRAAQALSEELQAGFAVVGRNRKPVIITLDTVKMELRLSDRSGIVYRTRNFGPASPYRIESRNVTASRLSVEIYPPGLAADSLSFMISKLGTSRRVRMLRGGLVQICSSGKLNQC